MRKLPSLKALIVGVVIGAAGTLFALTPAGVDFEFGLIWTVGIVCAVAAAYPAKFHRLATLILLGGTGLVRVSRMSWAVRSMVTLSLIALRWSSMGA